jgi:hypothetical protein
VCTYTHIYIHTYIHILHIPISKARYRQALGGMNHQGFRLRRHVLSQYLHMKKKFTYENFFFGGKDNHRKKTVVACIAMSFRSIFGCGGVCVCVCVWMCVGVCVCIDALAGYQSLHTHTHTHTHIGTSVSGRALPPDMSRIYTCIYTHTHTHIRIYRDQRIGEGLSA